MSKLCVFDLDGTLCDTYRDTMNSINHALRSFGLPPGPPSAYFEYLRKGNLMKGLIGADKYTDELYEKVRACYKSYHLEHLADTTKPYPGIPELLEKLNREDVLCGVLTNKKDPFAKRMMSVLFPRGTFRFVVGKSKLYPVKPDPTALNVLLSTYDIKKSECLVIGDSDVEFNTARNAGVACVGVTWGYESELMLAKQPDFVANSVEELGCLILRKESESA